MLEIKDLRASAGGKEILQGISLTIGKGEVHEIVTGRSVPSSESRLALGKLAVFSGISSFPVRVKCATLSWHALKAALEQGSGAVSTEQDIQGA